MSVHRIPLEEFSALSTFTELSSVALGGQIVAVSDEFFAAAFHLLLVEPAPSLKGQFGPQGALFSGWESRRHNPTYDWVIIKLGTPGKLIGFDCDTSHFNGNEAPQVSVDALYSTSELEPSVGDERWSELLPRTDLGPDARHLFKIPETSTVNYVKLNMYPDGGIARFRAYGTVTAVFPENPLERFDLAHVFAGGRAEFSSDQHFGVASNLIIPGRGKDMGDGWETKRSRAKGHKDCAVIRLGAPGYLQYAEIDTAHFKGNFPYAVELHGLYHPEAVDWTTPEDTHEWVQILNTTRLGPHRQHFLQLENVEDKAYTHVKLTILPDGGVKRLRIVGTLSPAKAGPMPAEPTTSDSLLKSPTSKSASPLPAAILVLPITPEAFSPFGQVIQAYADHDAAPRNMLITSANQGSASKFHKLSLLTSSYPYGSGATAGLSVYRCQKTEHVDGTFRLTTLERHPYTNQSFIPMGSEAVIPAYLVVVAQNGPDEKPDLTTLRAFVANGDQGIVYNTGIWHQPMTSLKTMDFVCVETQVGDGYKLDCEILDIDTRTMRLL